MRVRGNYMLVDATMPEKIKSKVLEILEKIEYLNNVEILYACESGSRAWGFSSPNSDYDVRFIYRRPINTYITILQRTEVIDRHNGKDLSKTLIRAASDDLDIDVCGWDISKTLYLIGKGNPAISEWLRSPIIYKAEQEVLNNLRNLSDTFYINKSAIYNYEHMARKNFNQYILNVKGPLLLKKYLYVLRPLYACEWVNIYGTVPPMLFHELYNNEDINKYPLYEEMLPELLKLIEAKKAGMDLGRDEHLKILDENCAILLDRFHNIYLNMTNDKELSRKEIDKLLFKIISKKEAGML